MRVLISGLQYIDNQKQYTLTLFKIFLGYKKTIEVNYKVGSEEWWKQVSVKSTAKAQFDDPTPFVKINLKQATPQNVQGQWLLG